VVPVLVSVIVPVFNGARFLAECIESLTGQDHPAVEVIVVDAGSTDGSGDLAATFSRVRLLRRTYESIGASRNAGIGAATGSLIGFCDSDDMWRPGKARRQVAYLQARPDVAIVLCRQETVFEPGVPWPAWLRPDQVRGDLDGVSAMSGLFRRAVFDRLGGVRAAEIGADFEHGLLYRARAAGLKIEVLEELLTLRRIHDANTTTRQGSSLPLMFTSVRDHLRSRR